VEVELNEKLEFMIMEATMRLLFKMDKKDYDKCTLKDLEYGNKTENHRK